MMRCLQIALLMLMCGSMSGCLGRRQLVVIRSDQEVKRVKAGEVLPDGHRASVDGWFLPDARYQSLRECCGDRITEKLKANPK